MSDKAYIIQKQHFDIEEVNFEQLKEYTDNVILEYSYTDLMYFKRALFELDRLNFNIGILVTDDTGISAKILLKDLLENIRGFNINIGVWLNVTDEDKLRTMYDTLEKSAYNNFITGIRGDYDIDNGHYPVWKENGDISDFSNITLDFFHQTLHTVKLNTNYKKIYKENNLKSLKSNENVSDIIK